MRILLLSTYFAPDTSSNSVIVTDLAERLVEAGHAVTVVTTFPHYDINRIWDRYRGRLVQRERNGNLDVFRTYVYLPQRKTNIVGRVWSYLSFNVLSFLVGLITGPCDVVLAPSPPLTNGGVAWLLSRLKGARFVYNVQDIYPDVAIKLGVLKSRRAIAFFSWLERFIYRKADAITVISEGFRRNLLAKGVPEEKLQLIHNFVDTKFMVPRPRHNRFSRDHGLDNRYVALFAGNVGLSQGLSTVLEASRLLQPHPDILCLIVGDGAGKADLVTQVEQAGLANVRFLPFQPRSMLPDMYATADVCLVPLKHGIAENSVPSKVYTIMAAARPLIASIDEGSDVWQFVQETGCGLVVPPEDPNAVADAILSLYHNRSLGREMGLKARDRVERDYTPQIVADKYTELFRQL